MNSFLTLEEIQHCGLIEFNVIFLNAQLRLYI